MNPHKYIIDVGGSSTANSTNEAIMSDSVRTLLRGKQLSGEDVKKVEGSSNGHLAQQRQGNLGCHGN